MSRVNLSFQRLSRIHEEIEKAFLEYQLGLLEGDLGGASESLAQCRKRLQKHMELEEKSLLPLYAERGGDCLVGGRVRFFQAEHRKLLQHLAELEEKLLQGPPERELRPLRLWILNQLERSFFFLHLLRHHDQREQQLLYPHLDRVTSHREREKLLGEPCSRDKLRGSERDPALGRIRS